MNQPKQRKTTLATGFAGSYEQYQGDILSLDKLLVQTEAATYYMFVSGENAGARIKSGDIIVVDKSLTAANNDIVVAVINAEFAIRRINIKHNCIELYRDKHIPSEIISDDELHIWGVVTASITPHRKFKL